MKALILAAGYATRLRPLTDDDPQDAAPARGAADARLPRRPPREVDEIDEIHLVTNARFAEAFRDWAPEDATVHDDGTSRTKTGWARSATSRSRSSAAASKARTCSSSRATTSSATRSPTSSISGAAKDGSAIAVHEIGDRELLRQYGVVELDEDDRVVGFEEKPAEPRSDLAATASYLYRAEHLELLPRYLEEGNPPDAPGNLIVWLYTREPVYGYRAEGEWHDIGDLGQLARGRQHDARARRACRSRVGIFTELARFRHSSARTVARCCSISSSRAAASSAARRRDALRDVRRRR